MTPKIGQSALWKAAEKREVLTNHQTMIARRGPAMSKAVSMQHMFSSLLVDWRQGVDRGQVDGLIQGVALVPGALQQDDERQPIAFGEGKIH